MTTNYIDRLDTALIRPGRVDRQQYIGLATEYQLRIMYQRFYPEHTELCEQFVQTIVRSGAKLTVAELQAYFLIHKNNPQLATRDAGVLAQQVIERDAMIQQHNRVHDTSHTASVASATKL